MRLHSASPTEMAGPELTIFTSTVYPDLVRLWHATLRRAFSPAQAAVEIFHDAEAPALDPGLLPGATLLSRGPLRRNFQEAYNDAVRRATTPYLALVDCDIFWTSSTLWQRVQRRLQDPKLAAFACVSRHKKQSHGTYAVVLKTDIYRRMLERYPEGFCEAIHNLDPRLPPETWRRYDTGDWISQAVVDAGFDIEFQHLEDEGELVRFENTTVFRLTIGHTGIEPLLRVLGGNRFFWRGYLGNLVLKRLHGRLFPQGPSYDFPYGDDSPCESLSAMLSQGRVAAYRARLEAGARRIASFLSSGGGEPLTSGAPSNRDDLLGTRGAT